MPNTPIGIAGAGKLGSALARLLREAGEPVEAIASRTPGHAERGAGFAGAPVRAVSLAEFARGCDRVLITVSDDAIAEVAGQLAESGFSGQAVLHTCGALGTKPLAALARRGVSCGALHPMQTIPTPERGLDALRGIHWGVTADGAASRWASHVVGLLDGRRLDIPEEARALYHAAGVTACNYFVALEDAAASMMEAVGVERSAALAALAPIVGATCRNIFELGPTDALTGPVLRGDVETIRRHVATLEAVPPAAGELYRAGARQALTIARRRGLPDESAQQLETILRENGIRNG